MVWYPGAIVRRYATDGGAMEGGPPRVGLHYTQTAGVPGYGGQSSSINSAPTFTVARDGKVYQHHPANRAARALRNLSGGVQTNRRGSFNIQFELVGYSERPHEMPPIQRTAAREVIVWACQISGTPLSWRPIIRGSHCYGTASSCRMSNAEWLNYSGIYAHQEVPENTHWDTGALDFAWLLEGSSQGEDVAIKTIDLVKTFTPAHIDKLVDTDVIGPLNSDPNGRKIYWKNKLVNPADPEWEDVRRAMEAAALYRQAVDLPGSVATGSGIPLGDLDISLSGTLTGKGRHST